MAEILKRLIAVNWSIEEAINQSLGARGTAAWDLQSFAGAYIQSFIGLLLPLAGVLLAFISISEKKLLRIFILAAFCFVIAILMTTGGRTPIAISFGALALFTFISRKSLIERLVTIGILMIAMSLIFSAMIIFRADGFIANNREDQREFEVIYHQDDNYYQLISVYEHAETSQESWNAVYYFSTIAINPIPRDIWNNKPLLTQSFYGGYKLDYITIMYLGEIVAMSGTFLSIFFGVITGVILYSILFKSLNLLKYRLGLCGYLLVAAYIYMCMRSLSNLTQFIYMPMVGVTFILLLNKKYEKLRIKKIKCN